MCECIYEFGESNVYTTSVCSILYGNMYSRFSLCVCVCVGQGNVNTTAVHLDLANFCIQDLIQACFVLSSCLRLCVFRRIVCAPVEVIFVYLHSPFVKGEYSFWGMGRVYA